MSDDHRYTFGIDVGYDEATAVMCAVRDGKLYVVSEVTAKGTVNDLIRCAQGVYVHSLPWKQRYVEMFRIIWAWTTHKISVSVGRRSR